MAVRSLARDATSLALAPREQPDAPHPSYVRMKDEPKDADANRAALERLARAHYDFVWRTARRLGLAEMEIDDVVQEVFLTASRHVASIQNERGFLFRTCQFACSHARRVTKRRREVVDDDLVAGAVDTRATPEENVAQAQARDQLQELLDELSPDLRAIFVLFELERLTMVEIAEMLDLPSGTVASRLRRARELFTAAAQRKGLT